jgi:DNA polymerase
MKKSNYLHAMGIDVWLEKSHKKANIAVIDPWEDLEKRVKACQACGLHKTRTQTVFGVGNKNADLMLIGEAPGAQEDLKGEPFVGPAGQLLNKILAAVQLTRDDVYIANILKSRPPNNRDPQPEEVAACTPFLNEQIALIKPKLIVALGRISAQYLLKTSTSLTKLRGQMFTYGEQKIPLIVTFHPAYLLRSPEEKGKAWEDWKNIKKRLTA